MKKQIAITMLGMILVMSFASAYTCSLSISEDLQKTVYDLSEKEETPYLRAVVFKLMDTLNFIIGKEIEYCRDNRPKPNSGGGSGNKPQTNLVTEEFEENDKNKDGAINGLDIPKLKAEVSQKEVAFKKCLVDGCDNLQFDLDGNGVVNGLDISYFKNWIQGETDKMKEEMLYG